jgi:type I restriction enzyme S subunit
VYLPEYSEQVKIGDLLYSIEQKIQINRRINDNLQQQLQTVYAKLFMSVKKSHKWATGMLSDIANITMGQSPSGDSYNESQVGSVFYQGSTDFGDIFPSARIYTTQPNRMAYTKDTLLSVRAPVGTLNIAFENCCIGRGLAAVKGIYDNNCFVRYLLKANSWYFKNLNNGGTTFGSLTKDDLYEMPITIPDVSSMQTFERLAQSFENQIFKNEHENRKLIELRDWLLPMLMNGQAIIVD